MGDIDKIGDIKKLFKKSDYYTVNDSTDTGWTITFNGDRYGGYVLELTGTGLLGGTSKLSGTGIITSITVTPPLGSDEAEWKETDLDLSGSLFLKKTKLDRLKDDDNDDEVEGTEDSDRLRGDDENNTLEGLGGNDRLRGDDGDDNLDGGDGNDRVEGDKGSDTVKGGAGDDRLKGGKDDDTFVFTAGGGHDRVDDFEGSVRSDDDDIGDDDDDSDKPGEGDVLDFIDFGLTTGDGTFDTMEEIIAATGATQVGEHVVFSLEGGATTITLKEVSLSTLTADDFKFV